MNFKPADLSLTSAWRAMKFGIVGLSGVALNMLVLWLLKEQAHTPLWLASSSAIELSILNNFLWNYHWTFVDRQSPRASAWLPALFKYHLAVSAAAVSNFAVLWLLHQRFGVHYLTANVLGILFGFVLNYLFSEHWVFNR
ncbi:GtrA family protein [candidate division KSB1 bacterium]|nr:GtrA family protein [candidate division KSB1 bacterium]